ncbi:hypothetical protein IF650_16110 [Cellulosimicrobium terreum]|nr:hypothetical protein [Cellulosimicrobium terreum]
MRGRSPDDLVHAWELELATTGRVQVAASRGRIALLLTGAVAFVAIGTWMLGDGLGARIIGIVAIAFFGTCLVILAVRLVRPEVLTVTRDGLSSGRTRLGWGEVAVVGMYVMHRNRILVLVLAPQAAVGREGFSAPVGRMAALTRLIPEPHVALRGPYADVPTLVTWLESVRRRAV